MTTSVPIEDNPQVSAYVGVPSERSGASTLSKLEVQITELEQRVDDALLEHVSRTTRDGAPAKPDAVNIWGVPFSRLTLSDTLHHVDDLVRSRNPGYFITANLNYVMLSANNVDLQRVNQNAAFIVCDGMPMVWRSWISRRKLPERVAGSELIYALTKWAATKGHRIFFLGAAPGVAQAAADKLSLRYPGLQVAGVESPPFRSLSAEESAELNSRIRAAKPDIVYAAFGQPKGELWMAENCDATEVPVCVQIGASFDFVVGGVPRAPKWIQLVGMEWAYRLVQEPRRLASRYFRNTVFLVGVLAREIGMSLFGSLQRPEKRKSSER